MKFMLTITMYWHPGGFEDFGFYEEAYDEDLNLIREFNEKRKTIATICVGHWRSKAAF